MVVRSLRVGSTTDTGGAATVVDCTHNVYHGRRSPSHSHESAPTEVRRDLGGVDYGSRG